jgi:CO/xanthine dehydrogenase Mo-binding subunit
MDVAQRAPGVLAIVTADNAGKLGKGNFNTAKLLGGPEIQHYHQAIALVVAETFEQARAAARWSASSTASSRALRSGQGQGQRQAAEG